MRLSPVFVQCRHGNGDYEVRIYLYKARITCVILKRCDTVVVM